ncbi:MAG: transcription-repair coupling factor [Lentisphaeria bacterium]|nr:transcription-repair coupling factor [Lentisphaeria bacterium]
MAATSFVQRTLSLWSHEEGFSRLPGRLLCRDTASIGLFAAGVTAGFPDQSVVFVTADSAGADALAHSLDCWRNLTGDCRRIIPVPEVRGLRREWFPENEASRCAALDQALGGRPGIYVAETGAVLPTDCDPAAFQTGTFTLKKGQMISPDEVVDTLVALDYDNEPLVGSPGEFSRRGGLLDIYSPSRRAPVRVDFFGDEIDSIRLFDPETQRSFETVETIRILPRGQAVFTAGDGEPVSFISYFPVHPVLVLCSPDQLIHHLETFGGDTLVSDWERLRETYAARSIHIIPEKDWAAAPRPAGPPPLSPAGYALPATLLPSLPELGAQASTLHWQLLRDNLLMWMKTNYTVTACCGNSGEAQRFQELLAQDPKAADIPVTCLPLPLSEGVVLPGHHVVMLSEKELFGKKGTGNRRRRRYQTDTPTSRAAELDEGCLAVHAAQGICVYHGIRMIEAGGALQETMELEFADDARLFVPLDQSSLVSRYVGGTRHLPRLSKIGGAAWKNNKLSAAASANDLAAELLRLEAMRQHARGYQFNGQSDWEEDFAAAFPYVETADQTKAIEETLADMADPRPMDRLLCGDVGYGKTEVAMRAAFRAVMNGKQVAVLVPTTILAQQHFTTFRERMAEYPVIIEALSRFKTSGEQNLILERLALGHVDIIIGTHRLVQKDVAFADLGLVIIDEEQRFGVRHKETLKHLRASVDILTMTATPIPRTLYFSLSGLKNLSTIMTPPAERLPVKTVVAQYDKHIIRDAVMRELERHGQVFILHNRVRTIEAFCRELSHLVPEARFAVAHGQMSSHDLEAVMVDYVEGHVDVLVCTTIIESGVDIPNANTIIIDRAERFGLAELYQLRGRVGRYHNQAYAYLLLPPMGTLPKNARERIAAIRQYTHLGAGFKLALRDLEIRGAGNILGQEQSGQIAAVGFELYCELLRDAVARLENMPTQAEKTTRVMMDTVAFGTQTGAGKAPAAFPPSYIDSEDIRVACYQRLQKIHAEDDLNQFEEELVDRFGPLPSPADTLLTISAIRVLAENKGIQELTVSKGRVLMKANGATVGAVDGRVPRLTMTNPRDQLDELAELIRSLPDTPNL